MLPSTTTYDLILPEAWLIDKIRRAKRNQRHTVFVVTVNERGIITTMEAVPDWRIADSDSPNGNCRKRELQSGIIRILQQEFPHTSGGSYRVSRAHERANLFDQ